MNTIKELPDGKLDVQNELGESVLDSMGGPYHTRECAESAVRMLNAFDNVDSQIAGINQKLREAR